MLRDNIIRSTGGSTNIQWQGPWGDGTSYIINDLVENNGSSYIAISSHTSTINDEPGVGVNWETYWDLFVAGGVDGTDGADGAPGVDGVDGESFVWRGAWSIDATSYLINDVVYNNGSTYISIVHHSPLLDTEPGDGTSWITVWNIMALAGTDGVDGVDGTDGVDGAPGQDGADGVYTSCDELIFEMEMEFKTSYLCYFKEFTYNVSKQLTDIDIWTDSTANVKLFHKDLIYNAQKNLIQTDLIRISDGALLTSIFNYNASKQLISIERSGYCSCSSSSSSISSSSSTSVSSSSSSSTSVSSSSISSSTSWEPFENLFTYSIVDNDNDITIVDPITLNFDTVKRGGIAYVYYDFGAGTFTQNMKVNFDFQITFSQSGSGSINLISISNTLGTFYDGDLANDIIFVQAFNNVNNLRIRLKCSNTDNSDDYFDGGSTSNLLYCTFIRSGSTVTVDIYSDEDRTSLIDTLTITSETGAKRYLYVLQSIEVVGLDTISGLTQKFEIFYNSSSSSSSSTQP